MYWTFPSINVTRARPESCAFYLINKKICMKYRRIVRVARCATRFNVTHGPLLLYSSKCRLYRYKESVAAVSRKVSVTMIIYATAAAAALCTRAYELRLIVILSSFFHPCRARVGGGGSARRGTCTSDFKRRPTHYFKYTF